MLDASLNKDRLQLNIKVSEQFNFTVYRDFRNAYLQATQPNTQICVNLSSAKNIDSSAFGMLLLAREHAEKLGGSIVLKEPSDIAFKVLKIANFDKIFEIVH